MTAADRVSDLVVRAEQRARAVRLSASGLRILLAVAIVVGIYWRGVHDGRGSQELEHINHALEDNAHTLQAAAAHRDSTRVAAAAALAVSDTHRVITRAAQAKVAIVDDAHVAVAHVTHLEPNGAAAEAPTRETLGIDTLSVPPVVVAELRADRGQIGLDTTAMLKLKADNAALADVNEAQSARILLLEQKVGTVEHHAFWSGVKWGAAGAVVLGVVAHTLLR